MVIYTVYIFTGLLQRKNNKTRSCKNVWRKWSGRKRKRGQNHVGLIQGWTTSLTMRHMNKIWSLRSTDKQKLHLCTVESKDHSSLNLKKSVMSKIRELTILVQFKVNIFIHNLRLLGALVCPHFDQKMQCFIRLVYSTKFVPWYYCWIWINVHFSMFVLYCISAGFISEHQILYLSILVNALHVSCAVPESGNRLWAEWSNVEWN